MTVIQIRIPVRPAVEIIRLLQRMLRLRYERRIQRKVFLVKWAMLRRELTQTEEYQNFRRAVFARDKQCVMCGSRTGLIVHHKVMVSRDPRQALVVSNGEARCNRCHVSEHPWMAEEPAA